MKVMTKTSKQTTATLENLIPTIKKAILPEINKKFAKIDHQFSEINKQFGEVHGEIKSVKGEIKSMRSDLTSVVHKVNELNEKVDDIAESIKYLPTTEIYLTSQDKLMGELQKSQETTTITSQHYEDTNSRVDKIDNYLSFNSNIL